MAKKAARKSKGIVKSTGNMVVDNVHAKYGKIIESGTKVLADLQNFAVIGISPALDIALGGGLREGSCVVLTGDPKTGKTTTALFFAGKCQKLGKKVYYFNTEGRLTKENFVGIKGLDPDKINIVQANEDVAQVSAETFLNALETIVKQEEGLVAIVDSTSSMVPQDELDGEIRTGVRNALPRLLAMFFKRISGDVARTKAIIIFVTHNIANTGGSKFAPNKMADCGNMLQYQAGTNMVITHRGKWEVPKESGNHVGQVANWVVKTSAAGGTPNSTASSWIRYGIGIDESQEIAHIATEFAMIKQAGAWYTITSLIDLKGEGNPAINKFLKDNEILQPVLTNEEIDKMTDKQLEKYQKEDEERLEKAFKFQGMENVVNFLDQNPDLKDLLIAEVKGAIL